MRATVGISAEQTVVRGVVVPGTSEDEATGTAPRTFEEQVTDPAGAVPGALDRIVAAVAPDIRIENVAVVYRTAEERRAIVSELSEGGWSSASLVSLRTALAAILRSVPGQERYGAVLVLEAIDRRTSYAIVGADRVAVLASDTWQPGIAGADSVEAALPRIRQQWETARPEAVVLCGAAADSATVAEALERGLEIPVLFAPDATTAAARGAAIVAAGQIVESEPQAAPAVVRLRRPILAAVAAVAVLGATGLAVAQINDDREVAPASTATTVNPAPSTTAVSSATTPVLPPTDPATAPPADPPPPPEPPAPPPVENTPAYVEPAPAPPVVRAPRTTPPPAPRTQEPEPEPEPAEAPPEPEPPAAPPEPSRVGAPNSSGLFPGESPPPPPGSDPETSKQWWDNHWSMKERWLSGN